MLAIVAPVAKDLLQASIRFQAGFQISSPLPYVIAEIYLRLNFEHSPELNICVCVCLSVHKCVCTCMC